MKLNEIRNCNSKHYKPSFQAMELIIEKDAKAFIKNTVKNPRKQGFSKTCKWFGTSLFNETQVEEMLKQLQLVFRDIAEKMTGTAILSKHKTCEAIQIGYKNGKVNLESDTAQLLGTVNKGLF